MHKQQHFIHKLVSLWLFIGISLAFGYETQEQTTAVVPVELVETYTSVRKPHTVSYTKVVKAIHAAGYTSAYAIFSFTRFLEVQQHIIFHQMTVQQEAFLNTKPSFIVRLPQRTPLSDDTDRSQHLS
ncbi:hypothetical protein [uncultured Dokdonia sp.]|uniref:hypothetical protein n=1 Tax=uncultured Dokdonia sp. TaxID=575653 RepID=UPI00260B0FF1|nr:hypothetical protein [uncultured Dokdonia sp.]